MTVILSLINSRKGLGPQRHTKAAFFDARPNVTQALEIECRCVLRHQTLNLK